MTSVSDSLRFPLARPLLAGRSRLHALGWFLACVATVAMAAGSMPVAGWSVGHATPAPVARLAPDPATQVIPAAIGPAALQTGAAVRCHACGTVENVRVFHVLGAAAPSHEMTIRFRDGSRQTGSYSGTGGWRVGDPIILIEGAKLTKRT